MKRKKQKLPKSVRRDSLPRAQSIPLSETPLVIEKDAAAREADLRGRIVAQSFFSELEKIATAALAGDAMRTEEDLEQERQGEANPEDPARIRDPNHPTKKGTRRLSLHRANHLVMSKKADGSVNSASESEAGLQQKEDDEDETEKDEEAPPAHGIVGTKVDQLDNKRARGIPIIEPPPGFIYDPELSVFVPNADDPGWMQANKAGKAMRDKQLYDQGRSDETQDQAQRQLDDQVAEAARAKDDEEKAEDAQREQSIMQGQPPGQAQAEPPKPGGAGGPQTPASISGVAQVGEKVQKPKAETPKAKMTPKKKAPAKKPGAGGIKIEIGR